ncbi:MAG: hypothetical protein INR71_04130 [Terriglobus roseus]|nr:hypothetical protein [Terriglobus roseus]
MSGHPTGAMAQQFAPSMSPSGSRQGPSPNPADQMKRGTPQMGQKGLPAGNSPAGMEGVQGSRASPAPPFDPSMAPQFYPGVNPQMAGNMQRPPSSYPGGFQIPPNMTQQQAAEMQRRQQQFPGMMGQPQPGQQMGQQPGQPQPQPMGTPRQAQNNMPPPPAPQATSDPKANPTSPNQGGQPQPPTPSQQTKSIPKGNKKDKAPPNKVCHSHFSPSLGRCADKTTEGGKQEEPDQCRSDSSLGSWASDPDSEHAHYAHAPQQLQERSATRRGFSSASPACECTGARSCRARTAKSDAAEQRLGDGFWRRPVHGWNWRRCECP